ncbi:MAG: hypothetical protein U1B30_05060 [Pseudomonadota bacterium]|nr:hypothetical protein [Pseudomonadota bacterium]
MKKASEARRSYEMASAITQEVMPENLMAGTECDAAVACQFSVLAAWSELYREYANLLSGGENASD